MCTPRTEVNFTYLLVFLGADVMLSTLHLVQLCCEDGLFESY